MKISNKSFRRFLRRNNCYKQFMRNFKRDAKKNNIKPSLYRHLRSFKSYVIGYAFVWKDTPEGHRYWSDIDRKYKYWYRDTYK